jgi:hypothetical protein
MSITKAEKHAELQQALTIIQQNPQTRPADIGVTLDRPRWLKTKPSPRFRQIYVQRLLMPAGWYYEGMTWKALAEERPATKEVKQPNTQDTNVTGYNRLCDAPSEPPQRTSLTPGPSHTAPR